jgi:hypothetical protein
MSAIVNLLTRDNFQLSPLQILKNLSARLAKYSEAFWFIISFVLFIALGPFSAIVALIAVMSLASTGKNAVEPKSAR